MTSIVVEILTDIPRHFIRRDCPRMATSLSYQTLLALVPLVVLALSLITFVDAFYTLHQDFLFFLFENFLPGTISRVQDILQDLVLNAEEMTAVGLAGLAVTAVLLFLGIESSFHEIWRTKTTRNIFKRLFAYLLLILLGPVILSSSVTLMQYLTSLSQDVGIPFLTLLIPYVKFVLPFVTSFIVLFALYTLVPAQKVRALHATIGASVAAALFVGGKLIFGYYLVFFPALQVIYGALAILPLFLVWLYISWLLVMFGATITAVLGFYLKGNLTPLDEPVRLYDKT